MSNSTTSMRVALYGRVSTTDKGQDPEMQLRELREYCERRGWKIAQEYVDAGVSGSKDSRPALNRLMADAHSRKFDTVLVWKIDRWGRSLKHLVTSPRRPRRCRSRLCQPPRQPRPRHTVRSANDAAPGCDGRVRTSADTGAGQGWLAECESEGQAPGPAARLCQRTPYSDATRSGCLLARHRRRTGSWSGDCSPNRTEAFQKRLRWR